MFMFNFDAYSSEFKKIEERLKTDLDHLRTGRANASILDLVQVEAYGAMTPLKGMASITIPDSKTIAIEPWDKSILKEIEKAIVAANLGLQPVNDGKAVRLVMPPMTEEFRKELIKVVNQKMEQARIALRQLRDQIREKIFAEEKAKTMGEDERFRLQEKLDKQAKDFNDKIKLMGEEKEKEIMTI